MPPRPLPFSCPERASPKSFTLLLCILEGRRKLCGEDKLALKERTVDPWPVIHSKINVSAS